MHPHKDRLTAYLQHLRAIHASGAATDERSYYPALDTLLNAAGETLTPRVQALHDVKDAGMGHPDFLLQVESTGDTRAAVEVKGSAQSLDGLLKSDQVRRYLAQYGLVLTTNLREFALSDAKRADPIMRYALAADETAFWNAPLKSLSETHADRFADFLADVLTWDAPVKRPADLAVALARYAREALRRLESQAAESLDPLRRALSEALGIQFTNADGEHFFRSSLVQTLFYGLFSAWVAYQRQGARGDSFRWKDAGDYLGLPLVRELFERIAIPGQLEALDMRKPLEWAEHTLNRAEWPPFERAFESGNAINYFYEPFLQAFDPQLRKDLGVWYTPPEIVRYMVARVDHVLRHELGEADGLASPNVYVLDPCCGTGAYLLETLRFIADRLESRGEKGLIGAELQKAAMQRIFGFEIMPAPFVVAQLQIGLFLREMGAPLTNRRRAGVFLTNALTGWETRTQLGLEGFPELRHEAESVAHVKQSAPILVILGNPPYNGFAGTVMDEERSLTSAYRNPKRVPRPQGQGLNDLYARFFGMAERRIVEKTGRGIVCFISNYSWLDGLSHAGMRERFLDVFDGIWIDNLNGDKYRTGKLTPDGQPDPSIFSTEANPEGIQVGTAIATLVRKTAHRPSEAVFFRDLWGKTKRQQLTTAASYQTLLPDLELGYPLLPGLVGATYLAWPRLPDLFPSSFPGVKTSRDDVVVDIDRDRLLARMTHYFDPAVSHDRMRQLAPGAMEDSAGFQAESVRDTLRKRGFLPQNVVRYAYRPFDLRWLYWEPETKLLDRNRAEYFPHVFAGNLWLCATQHNRKEFNPPVVMPQLSSYHLIERGANLFPLYLKQNDAIGTEHTLNMTGKAEAYLERLAGHSSPSLFFHAVATLHAPAYRAENAGALRQDWPRIPLPSTMAALETSAALGRQLAALMDTETPVEGVTSGSVRDALKSIARPERLDNVPLNPDTDFVVRARWGYAGRGGITMPGQGKTTQRETAPDEFAGLGSRTCDVYLNDHALWRHIPLRVWEYTIGGYQVIKKWLSYREFDLLKRPLTLDEVREVTSIARRIAAILLLEPALDANYTAIRESAVPLA